jgi:hypothetical protein
MALQHGRFVPRAIQTSQRRKRRNAIAGAAT